MPYCLLLSTAALAIYGSPSLTDSYLFFSDLRASLLQFIPFSAITETHPEASTGTSCGPSAFEWSEHVLLGHTWFLLLCHIYQLIEDALQTPLSDGNGSVVWNAVACTECFVLPVSSCHEVQCCVSVWSVPEILTVRKRHPNALL